jgi:hypothetical protein
MKRHTGWGKQHVSDRMQMHAQFRKKAQEEKGERGRPKRENGMLKRILKTQDGRVQTGFVWFSVGPSSGLL